MLMSMKCTLLWEPLFHSDFVTGMCLIYWDRYTYGIIDLATVVKFSF